MTIWEAMTEDAREYITNNLCDKDSSIDEVIEFFRFDEEFLQSEADMVILAENLSSKSQKKYAP